MAEHNKNLDTQHCYAIFETRNNLRRHNVARYASDKDVTNRLIENEFYGHARIGAGQHRCKWFLLLHCVLFQDGEVMINRGESIACEPLVSGNQLLKGGIRTQIGLCAEAFCCDYLESGLRCYSHDRTRSGSLEKLSPPKIMNRST